jgi:SAM-dependent methyltransferase
MTRALPPSASVAQTHEGAKLHAPAAERNVDALCALLQTHGPARGAALEIASGTGQHIAALAANMPTLQWQPTDIAADRLRSIDAYVHDAGLKTVSPAVHLDATKAGWAKEHNDKDTILLSNLLHLISTEEAKTLIKEAAIALAPDGTLILYGPFMRGGKLTSEGDARFDAELRGADPLIGYKDTRDMLNWLHDAGLSAASHEMPANNLAFVARKPNP